MLASGLGNRPHISLEIEMPNLEPIEDPGGEWWDLFDTPGIGWRVRLQDDPYIVSLPYSSREALLEAFFGEEGPEIDESFQGM